ncbi:hypothetical protein [Microbacterium saperdae]|uniref:Uncharacterized protein n=1 Tax=Microbacterium saperdae TaxID=69368 RepID=A0A543BQW5_9MICO|nr:hypothetical protein [Microbacterium saperdae]TQL87211.1 hypothetical protein FB560_2878 [Microbacterium saperdae]GGM42078.1 hypothetical protein GCM10010489_11390 [Microbacterium saperdae]
MVKMNDRFFDDLLVSPELERHVTQVTEAIAEDARSRAPVESHDYQNGIRTSVKRQKRIVGLVQAFDWKSLIIEARFGVLVRSTRAVVGRGRRQGR